MQVIQEGELDATNKRLALVQFAPDTVVVRNQWIGIFLFPHHTLRAVS